MSRPRFIGLALFGLATLLLAIGVGSVCRGATRLTERGDATAAVEAAARRFVLASGTYDATRNAAYPQRLAALSTGDLRRALAAASVDAQSVQMQRRLTTHIETTDVTSFEAGRATVAVTVVQERRWIDPGSGTEQDERVRQRLRCQLVRQDGQWLVSAIELEAVEPAR